MFASLAFVVVIVVDQFRPDQIYHSDQNFSRSAFSQIFEDGINYEDAHHGNYFNMTCPGHVEISTGALPGLSGIYLNKDWDPETRRTRYCLADSEHEWIGAKDESKETDKTGSSPKRILVSTVGDEMKMKWGDDTKIVSVSLKDRSAIAMGGHAADAVYWYAEKAEIWTTSTYYRKDGSLPKWLTSFNESKKFPERHYGTTLSSLSDTTDVAIQAAKDAGLGKTNKPSALWVSYSTHDGFGHLTGEDPAEMKKVMNEENLQISRLLTELKKLAHGKSYVVVLTSDHGSSINASIGKKFRVPSGQLNVREVLQKTNQCMEEVGYKPKNKRPVVAHTYSMNFFLDTHYRNDLEASKALKKCVDKNYGHALVHTLTKDEILTNNIPQTPWFKGLPASFPTNTAADVVGILRPYWNSHNVNLVNHETPYPSDSHVPLAFWWPGVKKKTVHKTVVLTDIAPTLARILEVRRPSGAMGGLLEDVISSVPGIKKSRQSP